MTHYLNQINREWQCAGSNPPRFETYRDGDDLWVNQESQIEHCRGNKCVKYTGTGRYHAKRDVARLYVQGENDGGSNDFHTQLEVFTHEEKSLRDGTKKIKDVSDNSFVVFFVDSENKPHLAEQIRLLVPAAIIIEVVSLNFGRLNQLKVSLTSNVIIHSKEKSVADLAIINLVIYFRICPENFMKYLKQLEGSGNATINDNVIMDMNTDDWIIPRHSIVVTGDRFGETVKSIDSGERFHTVQTLGEIHNLMEKLC
jgi:hypothetical protein